MISITIVTARRAGRAARTYYRHPVQAVRRLRRARVSGATTPPTSRSSAELWTSALDVVDTTVSDIVLVLARDVVTIANEAAERVPAATVHLLAIHPLGSAEQARLRHSVVYQRCGTTAERVEYLRRHPQPQLIIERGNNLRHQKLSCFRQLFPFVAEGGVYVVGSLRAVHPSEAHKPPGWTIVGLLEQIDTLRAGASRHKARPATVELARSVANLEFRGDTAIARKGLAHQLKLRDSAANSILDARFGDRWGAVLASRAATSYESNARLFIHGEGPITEAPVIEVPERFLRRYETAQCWPLQRVRFSDCWLPDTFRHTMHDFLANRALNSAGDLARLKPGSGVPAVTRSARGPFFYFDTEYPGHFGHVLTEVVSRYWGWLETRKFAPDVRPLVSLKQGQDAVPAYQKEIFNALDIDIDSIEYIRWDECVEVHGLYAASPNLVHPYYADQELAGVWDRIRRRCERTDAPPSPERLFVSRRDRPIRTCLNSADVEAMFMQHGFELFYPEEHDFADQVTTFHRAKVIAGFGGSGMFSAMFAPGTTLLVVSGDGYTARNEYMIKSVAGGDLHYFWGDSRIKQPSGGWTWAAYQSNFVFDIERFEPEISQVLERESVYRPLGA